MSNCCNSRALIFFTCSLACSGKANALVLAWAEKGKQGLNPSDLEKLIIKQKGRCALSDTLMIFDKALSLNEIQALYNNQKP